MNNKPNFFIIGAPKCGTTALSEYLKEHPNIFVSEPKEPHFFADDMVNHRGISSNEEYHNLFSNVTDSHLAIGEASVWYLYSKKAVQNIYNYNKNAKIIIMLRKPVDMVYSMHSQHLYSLGEDEFDFEKAWNLEAERKKGKSLPKKILHIPNLFYSEIAKYYSQLQNVYKYFPKEQVKIILFDDFKRDTKAIFDETVQFLNVPFFEKNEFPTVNSNKTIKSKFIRNLITMEPDSVKKGRLKFKKMIGMEKVAMGSKIKKMNSVNTKRNPINDDIKKIVIENYRSEVDNLSKELEVDLSNWNL